MSAENHMQANKHEETLPFHMEYLPDFVLKKLEMELNETPEKKVKGLEELKQLLADHQVTKDIDFEDDFLVQYLRHSKYDIKKALKHVQNFVGAMKKHPNLFESVPDSYFVTKPSTKCLVVLPKRCPDGCTLVIDQIHKWDPEELALDDVKRMLLMAFLQLQRDQVSQINGFKTIWDFKGTTGIEYIRYITPQNLKLVHLLAVDVIPARYKQIHFINANFACRLFWAILRTFLPQKIRNRVFLHSNAEKLLDYFPSSVIPTEYGGDLADNPMASWIRHANEQHKTFTVKGQPNYPEINSLT